MNHLFKRRVFPLSFIFLLVTTVLFGFFISPVVAVDTVLESFDDEIIGTDSFVGDFFNITNGSSNMHEVYSSVYYSYPYCYYMYNPTTSDKLGVNVSWLADWSTLGDLWDFSVMVRWSASTCYQSRSYLVFYNHTNDEQIRIVLMDGWSCPTHDPSRVYNVDNNGAEDLVASGLTVDSWYRIRIRMLDSVTMEQSVYDSNGVLLGSTAVSGWRHTNSYTNWTYMHVIVEGASGGAYGNVYGKVYLDDIFVSTGDTGDYDYDYNSDYDCRCANPIMNYASVYLPDPRSGTAIDWWCVFTHAPTFWGSCVDGVFYVDPQVYIEHETVARYDETVQDVLLPVGSEQVDWVSDDVNDYMLIVNGNVCGSADAIVEYGAIGGYAIVWEDVNVSVDNEKIVFSFSCSKSIDSSYSPDPFYWYSVGCQFGGFGRTTTHNTPTMFWNDVVDGSPWGNARLSVCWCSSNISFVDEPSEDELEVIDDFDDYFGDGDNGTGYMEFLNWDEKCYYKVGMTPSIVFNLTGLDSGTKIVRYYIRFIDQDEISDVIDFYNFVEINGSYSRGIIDLNDISYVFEEEGEYYLTCHNTSDYGTSTEEFIHSSIHIHVCPDDSEGGGIGVGSSDFFLGFPLTLWLCIVGILVVVVMFMMPNLVLPNSSISPVVNLFSGFAGYLCCAFFGFFPMWVNFIVALLVIISLVYYLRTS